MNAKLGERPTSGPPSRPVSCALDLLAWTTLPHGCLEAIFKTLPLDTKRIARTKDGRFYDGDATLRSDDDSFTVIIPRPPGLFEGTLHAAERTSNSKGQTRPPDANGPCSLLVDFRQALAEHGNGDFLISVLKPPHQISGRPTLGGKALGSMKVAGHAVTRGEDLAFVIHFVGHPADHTIVERFWKLAGQAGASLTSVARDAIALRHFETPQAAWCAYLLAQPRAEERGFVQWSQELGLIYNAFAASAYALEEPNEKTTHGHSTELTAVTSRQRKRAEADPTQATGVGVKQRPGTASTDPVTRLVNHGKGIFSVELEDFQPFLKSNVSEDPSERFLRRQTLLMSLIDLVAECYRQLPAPGVDLPYLQSVIGPFEAACRAVLFWDQPLPSDADPRTTLYAKLDQVTAAEGGLWPLWARSATPDQAEGTGAGGDGTSAGRNRAVGSSDNEPVQPSPK